MTTKQSVNTCNWHFPAIVDFCNLSHNAQNSNTESHPQKYHKKNAMFGFRLYITIRTRFTEKGAKYFANAKSFGRDNLVQHTFLRWQPHGR